MPASASSIARQPQSAWPGRPYDDLGILACRADEELYPGHLAIVTSNGVSPTVALALTANLPDAMTVVGTFASVDAADEISGVIRYRGKTVFVGPVIFASSQAATLAAVATLANSTMDEAGFTAAQSIVFTSDATTITATAEVKGETIEVIWSVQGDGTVSHAIANPGIFSPNSAKPALGIVVDGVSAYSDEVDGVTKIDDLAACSVKQSGSIDIALAAAAAVTINADIYVNASGKFTATPAATTVWVPPGFLRVGGQAATTTNAPEGAAVRAFLRS